jgi:hypothetical protein
MTRHPILYTSATFLLLIIFSACSSPETPDQLLRRLMKSKIQDGKFDENPSGNTLVVLNSMDEDETHSLVGD